MSHNEQKIGNSSPNREGVVTPSISDLSDTNINSLSSNQVLKYNSSTSSWENSVSSSTVEYIWAGQGESNDYSNTGNTGSISNGDPWYVYDSNPINNISNSSITKVTNTHWIDYITLPEGVYVVDSQFFAEWSASGFLRVCLQKSTGTSPEWSSNDLYRLSAVGYVGETLSFYAVSNIVTGQFEITSSDVTNNRNKVRLTIVSKSNLKDYDGSTSQGNTPSEYNYIHLRKVQ